MSLAKELHVIFGMGPVGITLASELLAQHKQVRLVSRSGKGEIPAGAELVKADVMQSATVAELTQGAAVAYHAANVPYPDQVAVLPEMQKSMLAGVAASGAKLIVMDTLYMYGRTHGQPMTENTPFAATSRKGQMRALLANNYIKAHQDGKVRVALGRAADFYGPRVLNSALGDLVFPMALNGKRVQLLGNTKLAHSYSYIGDVAKGLALLGERDEALGRAWHLPVTPQMSQRDMVGIIEKTLGKKIGSVTLPKLAIQAFGLFDPFMREFVEMFYQYEEPQIVDASAIERAFGLKATPVEEAIAATIRWYQNYSLAIK